MSHLLKLDSSSLLVYIQFGVNYDLSVVKLVAGTPSTVPFKPLEHTDSGILRKCIVVVHCIVLGGG